MNRTAIITGASAGFGKALALKFLAQGAHVIVNARRKEKLEEIYKQYTKQVAIVAGDASNTETIDEMLLVARKAFSAPADLVIANAGRGLRGSVMNSDETQWEELLKINVIGVQKLIRRSALDMLSEIKKHKFLSKPFDIVVLGSCVGRNISPFSSLYGASKFAVNSLAEATRRELGPQGIRVSLIEPGIIKTEFQAVANYDENWFASVEEKFGPFPSAEDVANLINFIVCQPAHVHINDVMIRAVRQDYP
jgi:NADP-dependent 3-hydroxy acid dehydrogenase YdfG